MLKYGHQEFAYKTGLIFENEVNDLEEYFGSFMVDPEIGPIKFWSK